MPKYQLSPQQIQEISSAIKRANQRMSQIGKTYGYNSSVYKQEVGKFEKGAFSQFTRKTAAKARGRNVAKAAKGEYKPPESHLAFDTKAIMKLVREEGATSRVNTILSELAGVKITGNFTEANELGVDLKLDLKEVKGGGVPTLTKLDKRTEKKLESWGEDPGDYSKKELRSLTERLAEFSENFQTSYNNYIAKFGEESARQDPVVKVMYGEFRGGKRLTYSELGAIKERMDEMIGEAKSQALSFEADNQE